MTPPVFRRATRADLAAIVDLIADDDVNGWREKPGAPLGEGYVRAFAAIDADANNELVVGEIDGRIVATAQITIVPSLTQQGSSRAIIEGVRVSSALRSQGVGEKLIDHMVGIARARGCPSTQLTTSNARKRAHAFYARIGFAQSHLGYKRELS